MARFRQIKDPESKSLNKFLGINESQSEIEIKFGEWVSGYNWRSNRNFNLEKRPGHHTKINFGSGNVQGIYYGIIAGKEVLIACWNGNVYEYDMTVVTDTVDIADLITEGTVTIIGTIADAKTSIFWFKGNMLFVNGTDFKEYDGAVFQDVVPTVPYVIINSPPLGGGTLFQEFNLLTGEKRMTFIGDTTTLYQLPEDDIDSDLLIIYVNGVLKTENVDFTVNRTLGQITFNVGPPNLASVSVNWHKLEAGNAALVKNNKFVTKFGYKQDNTLFMFGNVNAKNVYIFSYINDYAYFSVNSFIPVLTDDFGITDLKPHYQSLLVFKEGSSYVINPSSNPNYELNKGLNPYDFGYEGLNDSIGNLASNMVQLIKDSIVTLDGNSMRLFTSTRGVRNEVEPDIISDRLQNSLRILNLRNAVTYDYEYSKEYWVNVDDKVYIWNYGNDTMYKYDGIQATEFIDVNDDIYYSSNGTVEHVSEEFYADGEVLGTAIKCTAYGGFLDFGVLNLEKTMKRHWASLAPFPNTSIKIRFITDQTTFEKAKESEIFYKLFDFGDVDFEDLSFETNPNPQPFQFKNKVKGFTYLQWYLENETNDEPVVFIELLMIPQTGGFSG